jgi:hypothetical protein
MFGEYIRNCGEPSLKIYGLTSRCNSTGGSFVKMLMVLSRLTIAVFLMMIALMSPLSVTLALLGMMPVKPRGLMN